MLFSRLKQLGAIVMSHHHGPILGRLVPIQYLERRPGAIVQQKPDHLRPPMLGGKVERMLSHPVAHHHLAPVLEQDLRRLDAPALGRPMDGQLPKRLVGNVDAGPGIEEDLDGLVPPPRGGDFQRSRPTHCPRTMQIDRCGVSREEIGQMLVVAVLGGLPYQMDVGLGLGLGCLAFLAMVGPGLGLAILGTKADQTTTRADGEFRLCILFAALMTLN